jgi:hypothetical protein
MPLGREMVEHRRETRVVDHHQRAVGGAQRHADVLPHLDAHRAGAHRLVDARDGLGGPAGLAERSTGKVAAKATRPGAACFNASATRCCTTMGGKSG